MNWKQLQRFLGFANFNHRFIQNYNTLATHFTALTSSKVPFQWTPTVEEVLQTLKARFMCVPTLQMPDPTSQFIVEADDSDVGVSVVLS